LKEKVAAPVYETLNVAVVFHRADHTTPVSKKVVANFAGKRRLLGRHISLAD
jgi:hypothetical protein